MSGNKIGIGLIGCGRQGIMLASALSNLRDAEIVAVADIDPTSRNQAVKDFRAKTDYHDFHDLLADGNVDTVVIALPHNLLAKAIIDSAYAGKHIFTEKPMATNMQEAKQIQQAVKGGGVKMMVGYTMRFDSPMIRMKKLITQGTIGRINLIDAAKHCEWLTPTGDVLGKRKWLASATEGGGILLWIGCHLIDSILWMVSSEVKNVFGHVRFNSDLGIDEASSFTILFKNGVLANANVSMQSWGEDYRFNSFEIFGSEGYIKYYGQARGVTIGKKGVWTGALTVYGPRTEEFRDPVVETLPESMPLREEMKEFISAIVQNRDPAVTLEDGIKVIQVIDAILKSNKTGRAVEF